MARTIKTAAQHRRDIAKAERERKMFREHQAVEERYEDLRDDVMSAIKNSGRSFQQIHGHFGPHPHTLENWAQKKISKPQLGKMQSALRAIGKDIGIIEHRRR